MPTSCLLYTSPKYGNDDDRADEIGVWLLRTFLEMIKKRHTYRNSEATTSILTITSNVVYGQYTGALPDGRDVYQRQVLQACFSSGCSCDSAAAMAPSCTFWKRWAAVR